MTDMTDEYNTPLETEDEQEFQKWATDNNRQQDLADYDMRGWWKENRTQAANGHFTDKFKKPSHPTFSDESKYNGVNGNKGGKWGTQDGKDTFTPGKTNLDHRSLDELDNYFKKVEPGNILIRPKGIELLYPSRGQ